MNSKFFSFTSLFIFLFSAIFNLLFSNFSFALSDENTFGFEKQKQDARDAELAQDLNLNKNEVKRSREYFENLINQTKKMADNPNYVPGQPINKNSATQNSGLQRKNGTTSSRSDIFKNTVVEKTSSSPATIKTQKKTSVKTTKPTTKSSTPSWQQQITPSRNSVVQRLKNL